MSVNSITNTKPQYNIPPKKTEENKKTNPLDINKDGSIALEGTIGGLGILGLATLAICLGRKNKNTDKVIQTSKGTIQNAVEKNAENIEKNVEKNTEQVAEELNNGISNIAEQLPKTNSIENKPIEEIAPEIRMNEQLEEAKQIILNGKRYKVAKKVSTRNLPKKLKVENREQLSQAANELRKQRQAQVVISKTAQEVNQNATRNMSIAKNNITSKTIEGLNQKQEAAALAVEQASQSSKILQEINSQNPTRRNARIAQHAKNIEATTIAKQREINANVQQRVEEISAEEEKKLQQALQKMETTTFEQREAQRQKLQINQAKATENKVQRLIKRDAKKAGNQRAYNNFIRRGFIDNEGNILNPAGLNNIINSPNSSASEKKIAQTLIS